MVASLEDYDGDGVLNSREQCVVGGILGIDQNNNGIDDACDNQAIKPNLTMEEVQEVVASGSVSADAYKKLINTVITDVDLPTDLSITNSKVQQNNVASLSPNLPKTNTQSKAYENAGTIYLMYVALGVGVGITMVVWILRCKKHRKEA